MKILEIKIMRGPNYWSVKHPRVVVMHLELEEEDHPGSYLRGFAQKLENLLPGLKDHYCSHSRESRFIERLYEGCPLAEVCQHIALELQRLAGMNVQFGLTRPASSPDVYIVAFAYQLEKAGAYAAKAAVRLVQDLLENTTEQQLLENIHHDVAALEQIREHCYPGPTTDAILQEARKKNIPCYQAGNTSPAILGHGFRQRRVQASVVSTTSSIAVDIAGDKEQTKRMLEKAGVPVPRGCVVRNAGELELALEKLSFPMVVKPLCGRQGKGAQTGIQSREQALNALQQAQEYSEEVVAEQMIQGHDYRLLVINYRLVAAALRTPAAVTGDGVSSIQQLIEQVNRDPNRGNGHGKVLTKIQPDENTMAILQQHRLSLQDILPAGQTLYLKSTANLSTGGTATDVTDLVHPDNVLMAERVARIIGLNICGIDLISPDISQSVYENNGAVIEVNAAPGFRMHLYPSQGQPRNVAQPVIDMLFPKGHPPRIPIVAVTGTNGKTTTTRLIAHIASVAGKKVGFTTTDGIYLYNRLLKKCDCAGPASASLILREPSVNYAVLECARGGLLRGGLAFDHCHVAVVTNISSDHLGQGEINSLEKMAELKSVVPQTVFPNGYAVLNADDDLVFGMQQSLNCHTALFSLHPDSERIQAHCAEGNLAAIAAHGEIEILEGYHRILVARLEDIPLTFGGTARFMVQNVLAATLAAYTSGIPVKVIAQGLQSFVPSPEQSPGRMNLFEFSQFRVLVDYAHNPAGLEAMGMYLETIEENHKIGIVAGVGDRRDEDLIMMGRIAGRIFDKIIIREDKDLRGRQPGEISALMRQGIKEVAPEKSVELVADELGAVWLALQEASWGSFIAICCDNCQQVINLLKDYLSGEQVSDRASTPGGGTMPQQSGESKPMA